MGGGLFSDGPVGSCLLHQDPTSIHFVVIVCICSWTISRVRTETAKFSIHQYLPSPVQWLSLDNKYVVRQINYETIQTKQQKIEIYIIEENGTIPKIVK